MAIQISSFRGPEWEIWHWTSDRDQLSRFFHNPIHTSYQMVRLCSFFIIIYTSACFIFAWTHHWTMHYFHKWKECTTCVGVENCAIWIQGKERNTKLRKKKRDGGRKVVLRRKWDRARGCYLVIYIKLLRWLGEKICDYYSLICKAMLWLALPLVATFNYMFMAPSVKPISTLPILHAKYWHSI